MKEFDGQDFLEEHQERANTKFVYRYEDGYDAEIHPTYESLSAQFAEYSEGRFAAYNVPIWIEYEHEVDFPALAVGVVLTRHGICMVWRSPATLEQFRDIQARMLRVWATRADSGFGRFLFGPNRGDAEQPA